MKRRKRAFTLMEIMIVILLITMISGVVGYKMKGTLDAGKKFKTEQAVLQLHDLLLIVLAEKGANAAEEIARNPLPYLQQYNLAKNADKLLVDGWGERFSIAVIDSDSDFKITSSHFQ